VSQTHNNPRLKTVGPCFRLFVLAVVLWLGPGMASADMGPPYRNFRPPPDYDQPATNIDPDAGSDADNSLSPPTAVGIAVLSFGVIVGGFGLVYWARRQIVTRRLSQFANRMPAKLPQRLATERPDVPQALDG